MGEKKKKRKKSHLPFGIIAFHSSQVANYFFIAGGGGGKKKKVSRKRKEVQSYTQVNQIFNTINEANQ